MTEHCDLAVVRRVPSSFFEALRMDEPEHAIDVAKAKEQHDRYVQTLKGILPTVLEVAADEACPDCMFIEDTAVVIGATAVITQPGAPSRRPETRPVRDVLSGLGLTIVDMSAVNPDALTDGGDVLFTGRELFVGLSKRTNAAGLEVLKSTFEVLGVPVYGVSVIEGLHLKSVVTFADTDVLVVANNRAGLAAFETIRQLSKFTYTGIVVPEAAAANVVRAGNTLLVPSGCAASEQLLCDRLSAAITIVRVENSEGAKADGALTCCSLLIRKPVK